MSGDNEMSLWANVILQAVHDATDGGTVDGRNSGRDVVRSQARNWFNLRNRDFIDVCNLAGLDPDAVYERSLAVIRRYDDAVRAGEKFKLIPEQEVKPPRVTVVKCYTAHGKTLTLAEWSALLSIPEYTLRSRLLGGRTPDEALRTDYKRKPRTNPGNPFGRKAQLYTVNGVSKTLTEWATGAGLSVHTLAQRIRKGRTMEAALAMKGKRMSLEDIA